MGTYNQPLTAYSGCHHRIHIPIRHTPHGEDVILKHLSSTNFIQKQSGKKKQKKQKKDEKQMYTKETHIRCRACSNSELFRELDNLIFVSTPYDKNGVICKENDFDLLTASELYLRSRSLRI